MQCESLKIIKLNCHFNFRISLPLLCTTQIHLARKKDFLYIYIFIHKYTFTQSTRKTDSIKLNIPDLLGSIVLDTEKKFLCEASPPICYFSPCFLAIFPSDKAAVKVWIQRSEWVISINLVPHVCSIARQQVAARHPHPAISFWWLRLLLY